MRNNRFYVFFPMLFALVNVISIFASFYISHIQIFRKDVPDVAHENLLILTTILYLLAEVLFKDFKIGRSASYWSTVKRSFRASISITSGLLFIFFFSGDIIYDRYFLGWFFTLLNLNMVVLRVSVHGGLDQYRKMGLNLRNAVIIGYDKLGQALFSTLCKSREHGIKCLGFYGEVLPSEAKDIRSQNVLGSISDFLKNTWDGLDYIYVSSNLSRETIHAIIERADNEFVKVKLLPSFALNQTKIYTLERFHNLSIINITDLPLDNAMNRFVKRVFDIVFSLIVIVFVLSWLFPLISFIIYLESGEPIIFKQKRHGQNNRIFECYKFRTMILNDESDTKWATKDDPRVTSVGTFLRKTSLDELPQFFNVLIGDMSIVGPRPHAVEMNEYYKNKVDRFYQRHAFKPGITGLAQALGYRGEIIEMYHIKNRVKLDRFYFRNWSFLLDLKIIIKTIIVLIKGQQSAY